MPIVRIPDPNALPTIPNDYVRQNNLIAIGFLQVNKSIWEDAANNIVQGAVFQVGGTIYYANAATAIGGVASAYIKLTPSGDGSTVAPTYIADLTGVTWNSTYNGYYDVSGNAYIFNMQFNYRKGDLSINLTHHDDTTIPAIEAGSGVEINGQWHYATIEIAISGVTANGTWYDILLTPSGTTFTASFIARNTGVWSDSLQGLYSGNNRVVACVYRDGSGNFINKNTLIVNNRIIKVKMEIGEWDMETDLGHDVLTGIPNDDILSVNCVIYNDTLNGWYPITYCPFDGTTAGSWFTQTAATITFRRTVGGQFDGGFFNDTGFNRGEMTLTYKA